MLASATPDKIRLMALFGRNFGMMQQTINDIADFVPATMVGGTEEKLSEDAFADVKNKRLTLPVINGFYGRSKESIVQAWDACENYSDYVGLTKSLLADGSISRSQKEAEKFARLARSLIIGIPLPWHELFEDMLHVAYSNRYYRALSRING